ncbi:MAG TPA: hypothetical protein VE984_09750 [Gaiellaceae bacterium]|nr:hypothetical protein [Gaiellaceae bacterium]
MLVHEAGTIIDLDQETLTIRDDTGQRRHLPADYAADHLDYGYALTGHAAQGATFDRAYVLLRDRGALREWGYVACSRACNQTRLYLADDDTLERETLRRDPDPAASTEGAARALESPAAEPLALDATARRNDVNARLHARRQEELELQRDEIAEQLATAQRELKQLGWWKRGDRRLALEAEIGLYQSSLRLADERRAQLALVPPPPTPPKSPEHDHDPLTRAPSLRPAPPRRTIEREPPSLGLEL